MQRNTRISEQESVKNKNTENVNIMKELNSFEKKNDSKLDQLYSNSYQSQMAAKMNFIKKMQNNQTSFVQGIPIYHGYGVNKLKKSLNLQNISQIQKVDIEENDDSNLKTQQSATIDEDESQKQFSSNSSSQQDANNQDSTEILSESKDSLLNIENNKDSNSVVRNNDRCNRSNLSQKADSTSNSSSSNKDVTQYYTANQVNEECAKSSSFVDLNISNIENQKLQYCSANQRIYNPNSFRGGKNQQETADKIKRIRLRNHQSATRSLNTKQQNNVLNSAGNNFAKLLKIAEGEVKEKSKQAIESIKNKLAINSENESVLVLKTQPQAHNDENQQIHSSFHQQNQSFVNFTKKKNSFISNDNHRPFQPISQNCSKQFQNNFMNKTHTSGFCAINEKLIKNSHHFQLTAFEQIIKPSIANNIQSLCITPNKSFSGKSANKSMSKSIENCHASKSDNKSSRINDENRKTLYKRMQNYNTFMKGKFAFHKLNKQKKQLSNISNVLYNGLLENYDVEGMSKTHNPSQNTTQPKKRFYDAEEENEEIDSPDFNHMRKYYNNKYGLKLQQLENEKSDNLNSTGKHRNSFSNSQTPVRKHKETSNSQKNSKNNSSKASSANQKYYSQSATTNNDNKFTQIYTDNLLNQSCADFLDLCNPQEISLMLINQSNYAKDLDSNDNTSSSQSSKNQNTSYNLQNFTQFTASTQRQSKSQSRRLTSGASKSRKKNDIEIQPWGDDFSPITMI